MENTKDVEEKCKASQLRLIPRWKITTLISKFSK